MTPTIWHNPRCSKSRQALQLLQDRGTEPEIRLYLQDPPSFDELAETLLKLGMRAIALVRTGEKVFKEEGLSKGADEEILISAMAEHPILIERPVVLHKGRAALGRPPEAVLDLL